jgi:hypothetical protein
VQNGHIRHHAASVGEVEQSILIQPLVLRDQFLGALSFHQHEPSAGFSDLQLEFAEKLAAALSLALENARLYEREHHIAETLQESLLALPARVNEFELAHAYRSAVEVARVGGDLYDAFETYDGRVCLVVGDISGKGLDAAVLTSLVRNTLRAYAMEPGATPQEVMGRLNAAVYTQTATEMFVTLFMALIEPFDGLPAASSLKKLIELFGGGDILDEARTLAKSREAIHCIDYLSELYRELKAAGLSDFVRFDLGLVNKINYYTGIVFLGYAEGAGEPVLTGGRYDGLTAAYGAEAPATGFGININSVSKCLPSPQLQKPDSVIHYEKGTLGMAIDLLNAQEPGSCELSPYETIERTLGFARGKSARRVLRIDKSGCITEIAAVETETLP